MKYETNVIHKGVFYPAGTDVPVGTPVSVEMTDDVPDCALDDNADGAVSTEDVEQLQEQAGEAFEAQEQAEETLDKREKPKRSRKPKEA